MSAEADDVWADAGAREKRAPDMQYLELPILWWKTQRGSHLASRPWTIQVPQHCQQAYDLGTLVAAWVSKVQQAWHSLQLVFQPGKVLKERTHILQAAHRYDRIGADLENTTIPPSAYYLAQCRELHDRQVSGPTVTVGWLSYVAGESKIVSQRALMLGASGSRIYITGRTRSSRGVGDILKAYQCYYNLQASTVIGDAPPAWTQELRRFRHDHEHEPTYSPGPGCNPAHRAKNIQEHFIFENVAVIIIDDRNGLCDIGSKYIGLNPNDAVTDKERAKRTTALQQYCQFVTELRYFSRVIYCHSPFPERFQMDVRLRQDSQMLAGMPKHFGCLPVNIEPCWQALERSASPAGRARM